MTRELEFDANMSPLWTFGELIDRTKQDMGSLSFVAEWVGPGERLPVFDTASLRDFAAGSDRRLFLAELLASYTHLAGGRVWSRTRRGWRKRAYSELDPLSLAELAASLKEAQRAAALRRLGDLALFLSGVFPDYVARHPLEPRHLARIAAAIESSEGRIGVPPVAAGAFPEGGVTVLEWLGRVSYQLVERRAQERGILADVAARFVDARRFLNVLTDRYLFPVRERWFPLA